MKRRHEKDRENECGRAALGRNEEFRPLSTGGDATARRPYQSSGETQTIRTFLADESPFVLALLARVLARDTRIAIVGSATDGRCFFQHACMSRADLVLLDFQMAGTDSVEIVRWLKQLRNRPIVVVITSEDSPISRARSLAAGADAFLLKTEELGVQLRRVIDNFFEGGLEKSSDGSFAPAGL